MNGTPARKGRTGFLLLLLLAASTGECSELAAQLRPYEPFRWELFDGANKFLVEAGASLLDEQRASLAGTEGRLFGVGDFRALVRTGRVVLEAGGTVQRFFTEERAFSAPLPDVRPAEDDKRRDSGDYRVITTVALTPAGGDADAAIRFGTRLPTTDNRAGLERDRIDFFATVVGRRDVGPVRGTAELGVGIHGTRSSTYEQSDVLIFGVGLEGLRGPILPGVFLVGHADGLNARTVRGNEELAEVRLSIRTPGRIWVRAEAVRGLTAFSPRLGLLLSVGLLR